MSHKRKGGRPPPSKPPNAIGRKGSGMELDDGAGVPVVSEIASGLPPSSGLGRGSDGGRKSQKKRVVGLTVDPSQKKQKQTTAGSPASEKEEKRKGARS